MDRDYRDKREYVYQESPSGHDLEFWIEYIKKRFRKPTYAIKENIFYDCWNICGD